MLDDIDRILAEGDFVPEYLPETIEQSYIVRRADTKIASGSVTLAVVDRDGKLQRIPDTLRDPLTRA